MRTIGYYVLASCFLAMVIIAYAHLATPVQAAPPAPPEVKPCQLVNTAKVSDALTILIFYCEPEGLPPYFINSAGFMFRDEQ